LETEISLFLEREGIEYEEQKKFPWLKNYRLDFYLPQYNVAIECQGRQHFEAVEQFGGEEQLRLQNEALHALQIGEFFKDSVLVGDSVAEGFNLYAMRNPAFPIFQNLKFLTKVSYSVHNAFMSSSYNPRFQGAQMYAWDSMRLMGIKHAYTFFGLNDLGSGVDNTVAQYLKYIARVQQEIPDIKITIVSTTPMYKGSEKKALNNASIRALNAEMAELAAENGWGYIDVASRLCDSDGCLAKQYCSDKYVHQNNSAYQIWQAAFEEYAEAHLEDSYDNA
jgi:lysophospholipase L1-like esterase